MSDEHVLSDPVTGAIVGTDCCPELAAAVRAGAPAILRRCESVVPRLLPRADQLTEPQLRNSLPDLLHHIADALESRRPRATENLRDVAPVHAATRFQQRFDVDELIVEYRILRQIILEEVHHALGRDLKLPELIALDVATGISIQAGVTTFVDHEREEVRGALAAESKYLSYLAHDLRNNLNGCTLMIELLKQRLLAAPGFEEDVKDMDSLQRSITETVDGMNRLLQAERVRRQATNLKFEPTDLAALAHDIARQLDHQAEPKGLAVRVSAAAGAVVVQSNRELIALVLQNLVGNAIKYSDRGTVGVAVRPAGPEGGWELAVSDEGPGIRPEHQRALFEAFVRGDTHGQPGLGLGLAIAAQATKLLGGALTVESTPGVGSVFRLVLPAAPGQRAKL